MSEPRELVDLGLIARLSGVSRTLAARHVREYGPDPVGRVGKTPYWNLEDLDPLLAAVEQGKARDKTRPQVVVIPDEADAVKSRVRVCDAGDLSEPIISDGAGQRVRFGDIESFLQIMGVQDVSSIRALCACDELKLANKLGEFAREVIEAELYQHT